jgi:dihydrofolate reductase
MMELKLIYARSRNGVIGREGQLPWHLPADLAHFKKTTLGQAVVMGRKTWDSLPERFRPLPGRTNIVITRQKDWQAKGALVVHSLAQALSQCPEPGPLWVIGGAEIYAQALPLASTVVVTEIDLDVSGDAHAPKLGTEWKEMSRLLHHNEDGLSFSFVHYSK